MDSNVSEKFTASSYKVQNIITSDTVDDSPKTYQGSMYYYYYYYYYYYWLSPICRVFTVTYLKQTMFSGYIFAAALYLQFMLHVILFSMLNVLHFYISTFRTGRHAVTQLVEALRYKPEGRGFDFRWCHWNFSLT